MAKTKAKPKKPAAKKASKPKRAKTPKTTWYAFCNVRKHPHAKDPGTLLYLPWQGPRRATSALASQDKNEHNRNPGHAATLMSAP